MKEILSPKEVQELLSIGKTKTYELFNEYEKQGGEVLYIGTRDRRVFTESFITFLKERVK